MKRYASVILLSTALAGLALSGCSLPGISFQGPAKQPGAMPAKAGRYRVQRITPKLLLVQSKARKKHEAGKPNPALKQAIENYHYEVEPRDVLSIVVWGDAGQSLSADSVSGTASSAGQGSAGANSSATPSGGFRVDSHGMLFYPYVGSVHVAGETAEQIRTQLTRLLKPYIKNPQVTVNVAQFNSQKYQIAGAVEKPGLYPVTDEPLTVSEAIAATGGVLRQNNALGYSSARSLGDLSNVLYVHDGKTMRLNLRALQLYGDTSQDRLVHPGDVIEVPDDSYDQVHLIGDVSKPGNYPLDNGRLNLAQALGDAGGLNLQTANAARIFVFRGAYAKPLIFWLNARSPQAMLLATDFNLQPQDVVYVATSGLSTWNRIVSQILPTVQALYETKVLVHP